MYELVAKISKRAYDAAKNRGKDVTPAGCREYLQNELNEYWDAVEGGKPTNFWHDVVSKAAQLKDSEIGRAHV